ncbi:DUF3823 domain-containing protein [Fibrella forsythiae]|uniref:DUF3823 domain-containing protein n=1 Tax=Fibrella forsythiae TaxID=2817061 RepID=A0ABS3JH09_9BACT|nr:DUF3823 domain-containing protein [Fibrella forsythiae]MBO0948688.1 DUF3823 domain-containing protein [Fibrella forsythiae]
MKAILFSLLAGTVLLASCAKDNYEPPKSTLTGRVIYDNQPVGVRTNGVQLELWQKGYQLFTKIPVIVSQEGTFSAALFDGDYKLVRLRGNGPWVDNTDTINVSVRGAATIDVPVQPFFVIRNPSIQRSGTSLTGSLTVGQVVTGRAIERVTMYVGTTQFVDVTNNVGSANVATAALADLSKPLPLSLTLPAAVSSRPYFYARIGVKTVGVAELIYSPVQKITL